MNVEQIGKRFLENRGLYFDGLTCFYKVSDVGSQEPKVGGSGDSPTVAELYYLPFAPSPSCSQPDLAAHILQFIDTRGMLTLLASDAFQTNGDAMISKGKNFYFADYSSGGKLLYFPWDRDSSLSNGSINGSVYIMSGNYGVTVLTVPELRAKYNSIFQDLLCGPWSAERLIAFLD
ncbi:MAG: CotH kinase family protein [Candidatus Hydrogenedentes bacterium]|nr:CotH kinase family protein [Candidatus Hydrogenedentota bacterium]